MFVTQNEQAPGEIQNALFDLMRNSVAAVRVCSAYVSMSGSDILFSGITRSAPGGDHERVSKTIVTCLDFGLTDPDALRFWSGLQNCNVRVASTHLLERGSLIPHAAYHPKLYLFEKADGTLSSLVGSANLTNRGLTINNEIAWSQEHAQAEPVNEAWDNAVRGTVPLTQQIVDRYDELRQRVPNKRPTEETEPVPEPAIGGLRRYRPFGDAGIAPEAYNQMWIRSRGMQGGARTQLELPRGAHRFFGAAYDDYNFAHVDHIAEPILVSGRKTWHDRPLTWHGDNAMERINLPSLAMGGFAYENSLILFRRIAPNTFELRVYPWDSDSARAYVEASRILGLVFRVGRNSNRLAGFLN